jgi:hypothetical protein
VLQKKTSKEEEAAIGQPALRVGSMPEIIA